jgi:superfamily II DNA or RNA helicase
MNFDFTDTGFFKDYSWQERAVEKLMENLPTFYSDKRGAFERAFVVEVSPSGGKTVFSLKAARALIEAGLIDKVFAVVPRETIKDGFAEDSGKVEMGLEFRLLDDRSIRIDDKLSNNYAGVLRNYHGAVIMYQSLAKFTGYADLLSQTGKRCLFIFDEIHHGRINEDADDCAAEWGQAIAAIKSIANAVICMTGTPVRTDNKQVPFFEYRKVTQEDPQSGDIIEGLMVQSDFRFAYADALNACVARKLIFRGQDPKIEFVREVRGENVMYSGPISGVDKKSLEKAKQHLFDPRNRLLDDMLKLAREENELDRTRGDPEAAILVIVGSTTSAGDNPLDYARDRIKALFGEEAVAVESKDDTSRDAIKRFKKGTGRWIIAKDMISEGTSIPRLRTALIFRDIKSEVRFQQLVHRITRNRSDTTGQDARVVYFCLPDMRKFAKAIEDEIRLVKLPDPIRCPNCDEVLEFRPKAGKPCPFCKYEPKPGEYEPKYFSFENVEFSGAEHVDQGGADYSPFDPISRVVLTKLPHAIGGRNGINEILRIAHEGEFIDLSGQKKQEQPFSVEERVKRNWDIGFDYCKSLAGIYSKNSGHDYQTAINEVVGACKRAAGFSGKKWQTVLREFADPVATMEKFSRVARQQYEAATNKRAS